MAGKSNIEWTGHTWNPFAGCAVLSPGCTNCYAMKMAARLDAMGQPLYKGLTKPSKAGPVWRGTVRANPEALLAPLKRKKPTTYFVNSMSDLFYENFPDELIDQVFAVMALCPQHTFQVLTKRAEWMRTYLSRDETRGRIAAARLVNLLRGAGAGNPDEVMPWPLPNVWLGVSTERQQEANERIPHLLQTPAAVRFISAEPLLGPIDLRNIALPDDRCDRRIDALTALVTRTMIGVSKEEWYADANLDWVIVGGESGPNARPFDVKWADSIVEECEEAQVACFVKQLGASPISDGYPLELHDRKGGDPGEWPDRLAVRQMPQVAA
jgi:protein gp37